MDSGKSVNNNELANSVGSLLASQAGSYDDLWETVYADLRRHARALLARERPNHTLRPTEVVHELWMRIAQSNGTQFQSRAEFFAFAGRVMRHVLVDHARTRQTLRRGGDSPNPDPREAFPFLNENLEQVLQVDQLATRLAEWNGRLASVVELRFFAGLTEVEIAEALDLSVRTVKRDWQTAKAWMLAELKQP